jgi:type IV pilus assembly protein PilB
MQISSKRIGEILLKKELITEEQLQEALKEQRVNHGYLGAILISKGWINRREFLEALAEQYGISFIDLKIEYIDMELARQFPSSLIQEHCCFPFRQDDESISVAIANPLDVTAISKIEQTAKPRRVNLVLAAEEDIREAIQKYRQYISKNIQRMLKRDEGI